MASKEVVNSGSCSYQLFVILASEPLASKVEKPWDVVGVGDCILSDSEVIGSRCLQEMTKLTLTGRPISADTQTRIQCN